MISSLPIILGQGPPAHGEKVPILHSLPASDSTLTPVMRTSDENPTTTMGDLQPEDVRHQVSIVLGANFFIQLSVKKSITILF